MIVVVLVDQLRSERRRQEVVVHGVLFRDSVPIDGVPVIEPVGEIGSDLALAWAIVQVTVLNRLSPAHFIDADVSSQGRAAGDENNSAAEDNRQSCQRADRD